MIIRVAMTISAEPGGGKTRMVNTILKALRTEYDIFDYGMTEFPDREIHAFLASRKDESDDRSEASGT